MGQPHLDPEAGLVDLAGISLDQIEDLDDSVLARSLRALLERLGDGRLPLDSFNASI
jgi:FXSXX-COOH protein